jgi:hypothetical protein
MSMTSISPTAAAGVQIQLQRDQQKLAVDKAIPASQQELAADRAAVTRSQAAVAQKATTIDVYA